MGWISPTSHSDVDGVWNDEIKAYDGSTTTIAYTNTDEIQHWLELILSTSISCDKIRIYAKEGPAFDTDVDVDIDIYDVDLSNWVDVFSGVVTKNIWVEKSIPGGTKNISKARVWWDSKIGPSRKMFLHEFEFNEVEGIVRPLINGSLVANGLVNKGLAL